MEGHRDIRGRDRDAFPEHIWHHGYLPNNPGRPENPSVFTADICARLRLEEHFSQRLRDWNLIP